jgi:hypothetical protein
MASDVRRNPKHVERTIRDRVLRREKEKRINRQLRSSRLLISSVRFRGADIG